jgi:integrase/recombinase XerD
MTSWLASGGFKPVGLLARGASAFHNFFRIGHLGGTMSKQKKDEGPTLFDLEASPCGASQDVKLLDEYAVHLRVEKGRRPLTVSAYRGDLEGFRDSLPVGITLLDARVADVEAHLLHLSATGILDRSASRKLSPLRGFYQRLARDNRIAANPTMFSRVKKTWDDTPRSMTEEEIEEMLDFKTLDSDDPVAQAIARRNQAIRELLYDTGLRATEVCTLNTFDIDFDAGTIFVHGKGGKDRIVPMIDRARETLERYLRHVRPILVSASTSEKHAGAERAIPIDDPGRKAAKRKPGARSPLFISVHAEMLTRQWIWHVVKLTNPNCSPHILRHSCATHMINHEADLVQVQELLGHAWLSSTTIYTGPVPPEKIKEVYRQSHPRAHLKRAEAAEGARSLQKAARSGIHLVSATDSTTKLLKEGNA